MSPSVPLASESAVYRNALWTCLLRTRILIERTHAATAAASSLRYTRRTDHRLMAALRRSRWHITTGRPLPRVMRRKDV